tara:strand:+ start:8824 stop:9417 length:594 start_codon:yes stop_codon:yes gene_type:complete
VFVGNKRKIGILGGSFDPPHLGHIAVAEFVASKRDLDEVLFVVANIQWQKAMEREMLNSDLRLEMVKLAVAEKDNFYASNLEIERGGDSVTVETLEALHDSDSEAEYELIIGADNATTMSTWRRSEEIEKYAKIIVLKRPGIQLSDEDKEFNFVILDGPRLDISSAEIRSAIKVGDRIDHLVPKSVMDYIYQEGLYR